MKKSIETELKYNLCKIKKIIEKSNKILINLKCITHLFF